MTTMQHPLEALLRPPVEWYTAFSASVLAVCLICFPQIFLLHSMMADSLALGFVCFAGYRFKQGYRVVRYQQRLKQLSFYAMPLAKLPVSQETLLLGKGFLWTTQHTQRLRDLDLDYNASFKNANCHHLHGIAEHEKNITMQLSDRASHLLVLGLPGVGKTRFAELLISQDMARGDVVIVLDPKGDVELLRSMVSEANRIGRAKDVMIFHLGFPAVSCRYNPIGHFTRVTEVANRISNQLPSSGESAAFKEFGWQFINSITLALLAMGEKPDYQKMVFYITKLDHLLERYLDFWLPQSENNLQAWVDHYVEQRKNRNPPPTRLKALTRYVLAHGLEKDPVFDDLYQASRYDHEYYSKITASLNPLLKKLTTGKSAELLSPDEADKEDVRPILNWLDVIKNKKIVYVGLDALTDPVVATAVGNAMFSDLVSVAGRLYKFGLGEPDSLPQEPLSSLPRICVHADEFNEIIGDEFVPLLNKGRGAGFTVTAYTQTWSDVEARLKSAAKAGQVAGNIGTVVLFRCKEAATVDMLLNQLPVVPILRILPASSAQDTAHGADGVYYQSTNEDRLAHSEQRLIEQNDVLNLPKGQAFCLLEGKLYKLRMPLPVHATDAVDLPIETFIGKSNQKKYIL